MKEETKKPLWNLCQEYVLSSITGYRSLMMLMAILGGRDKCGEGYDAALRHYTIALMNEPKLPKDGSLTPDDITKMIETCVHEHLKQITYSGVDITYMFKKFLLSSQVSEEDRIGYYLNAMEEQAACLDWNKNCLVFSANELKHGAICEVGCSNFQLAAKILEANLGRITSYLAVDKKEISPTRVKRFQTHHFKGNIELIKLDACANTAWFKNIEMPIVSANCVHCMEEPIRFMQDILDSTTPAILIIEPTPSSYLGYAFDFHMRAHGGWGMLYPNTFEMLAAEHSKTWKLLIQYPNTQFTAYRFIRK